MEKPDGCRYQLSVLPCGFPSCSCIVASDERKAERMAKKEVAKPKKKPIAKLSDKKAEKLLIYKSKRKDFLVENPICQASLQGCTRVSEEIHHCSTSELDFLNELTWMAVCRHDHNIIERELSAKERRELGFLI